MVKSGLSLERVLLETGFWYATAQSMGHSSYLATQMSRWQIELQWGSAFLGQYVGVQTGRIQQRARRVLANRN